MSYQKEWNAQISLQNSVLNTDKLASLWQDVSEPSKSQYMLRQLKSKRIWCNINNFWHENEDLSSLITLENLYSIKHILGNMVLNLQKFYSLFKCSLFYHLLSRMHIIFRKHLSHFCRKNIIYVWCKLEHCFIPEFFKKYKHNQDFTI